MSRALLVAEQLEAARDFTELHGLTGAATGAEWAAVAAKLKTLGLDAYPEAQALLARSTAISSKYWITPQAAEAAALALRPDGDELSAGRAQGVPEAKLALLFPLSAAELAKDYVNWLGRLTEVELPTVQQRLVEAELADSDSLIRLFDLAKVTRDGRTLFPEHSAYGFEKMLRRNRFIGQIRSTPQLGATVDQLVRLGSEVLFWLLARENGKISLGAQVNHVHAARFVASLRSEFGVKLTHTDLLREFHLSR